jgi:hypothetical protein
VVQATIFVHRDIVSTNETRRGIVEIRAAQLIGASQLEIRAKNFDDRAQCAFSFSR